ncbi:MAG: hypothetical protein B7Z37_31295, partial [Verrucomicrobia bacterium 12-59-8]
MTHELHSQFSKVLLATFALALASASLDVAHAQDAKPGFFKKLFGGGGKTETPAPAPAPEPAKKPASKPPQKTASKSSGSSKPRVIITTTGGKKVEIGKKTAPARTTATPKTREQPVQDVTKTASSGKGEFRADDDAVSTASSKSVEVL